MRWPLYALAAALFASMLLRPEHHASAGAVRTTVPIAAAATIHTELADYLIVLSGWATLGASPRLDNGVFVVDIGVIDLHLQGASPLGLLVVTPQHSDNTHISRGEVRSLQSSQVFPASSYLDLFVDVAAPNTNIGLVTFRNDDPLHLVPWDGTSEAPINNAWPFFGVTYHLTSHCVPLISQNPDLSLNACVSGLDIAIAPATASFAVGRGGPSHLQPASIFGLTPSAVSTTSQAPFLRIPCASLGLTADGCDDGTQDALDALSYGGDFSTTPGAPRVFFSVAPGAQGAPVSAVHQQVECPPSDPGVAPEPESDVFSSYFDDGNGLVFDGNGPVGTCTVAFPLGLVEAFSARDNLDALDLRDSSAVDADGDGVPERPIYFSLDAASPSLAALDVGPADIERTANGATPVSYASAAELGLRPGDDIDALCLRDNGDGAYGAGDLINFSLTPGSPTLAGIGAGPGDILAPGSPPVIVRTGLSLGLAAGDNIDALTCPGPVAPNGDVNCDGVANGSDAALELQYGAGLLGTLLCFVNADVNLDGAVNSIDTLLVLQLDAGLIGHLPP